MCELPFITSDIAAVPGVAKADYEDFIVEEIPAYLPSGSGDHVYFTIEKRGLTTHQAVRDIARALGVRPRDIGSAGNKDSKGVTRQTLSLEHVDPGRVESLSIPRIAVLSVSRHRNKLKTGHLKGNRFVLRLRDVDPARLGDVERVMDVLRSVGAPNYYGPQRFGNRGDTWKIGRASLKGDFDSAVAIAAGTPGDKDEGRVLEARTLFEAGRIKEAMNAWPSGFYECRAICASLLRSPDDPRRAILGLDKKILGLYVSAFQSRLFNAITAARISEMSSVKNGDVAWKHENGATFLVDDEEKERPRAERFEISATGPLFGHRMKAAAYEVADLEASMLEAEGFLPEDLPRSGPFEFTGGRRPLRFRPEETSAALGSDHRGDYLELRFDLPSGSYATVVLREILKKDVHSVAT